jgi:hypothetical protein
MKTLHALALRIAVLCGSVLLAGCAHVTFHPQQEGKDLPNTQVQTGVKYYNTKPYLLVSYTGNKDAPVNVSQINLPDLEHPVYAMYHRGLGSHQFTVSLSANGTLSSYGQTADSKIPELISAIGSMGSSLTTAAKAVAAQSAEEDQAKSQVIKAIGQLKIITVEMDQANTLVKTVYAPVTNAIGSLSQVVRDMNSGKFDQKEQVTKVVENLKTLNVADAQGTKEAVAINSAVNIAKAALQDAITALDKRSAGSTTVKPDFRLFEIKSVSGITTLVPVAMPSP